MSRFMYMLKWLLAGVLVWTVGWAVAVYRHGGPGLGPSAVLAVEEAPDVQAASGPIQTYAVDYAALRRHDPFRGSPPPAAQPRQPAGDSLGIALIGTVSGQAPLARAIVQDLKSKATRVCRIGDRVGEATLESVSRDAAVFGVQGRRLVLKRSESRVSPVDPSPATKGADSGRSAGVATAPVQPTAAVASDTAILQFLDRAAATPVRMDNGVEGLRLTGLDGIPGAAHWGLEDGDVICAVNGQPLADPKKAFQILKKVRSQERVRVDLVRKGQRKTLSLDLR